MNMMIKQLVYHKLKNLTGSELLDYAREYNFSLSKEEADEIVNYFRNMDVDPFSKRDRRDFFLQLEEITNVFTARKAENLFYTLIEKYNLTYLFHE